MVVVVVVVVLVVVVVVLLFICVSIPCFTGMMTYVLMERINLKALLLLSSIQFR